MTAPPLAWIDLETTGLDALSCEILEIAVIQTTHRLEEQAARSWLVMPERPDDVSDYSRQTVGFSVEAWRKRGARCLAAVLPEVVDFTAGRRLAGHNVTFDRNFLTIACRQLRLRPRWNFRLLDTASLCYPWILSGRLRSEPSLAALCRVCGVTNPRAHRAMPDARATLECARILLGLV